MKKVEPKGKKVFCLKYPDLHSILKIEIDFDHNINNENKTIDCIEEMVKLWPGWKIRVKFNDDCFVRVFLQQLMIEAVKVGIEYNWNLYGIQCYFNEGTLEVYYPLNKIGIKILSWNTLNLDEYDVIIDQIKTP